MFCSSFKQLPPPMYKFPYGSKSKDQVDGESDSNTVKMKKKWVEIIQKKKNVSNNLQSVVNRENWSFVML